MLLWQGNRKKERAARGHLFERTAPSAPASEASRHFLGGAATPPCKGGEWQPPDSSVVGPFEFPHVKSCGGVRPVGTRRAIPRLSKAGWLRAARPGRSVQGYPAKPLFIEMSAQQRAPFIWLPVPGVRSLSAARRPSGSARSNPNAGGSCTAHCRSHGRDWARAEGRSPYSL